MHGEAAACVLAVAVAVAATVAVVVFVWAGLRGGGQQAPVSAAAAGRGQRDVATVVRLLRALPGHAAAGDTADLAPSLRVPPPRCRYLDILLRNPGKPR